MRIPITLGAFFYFHFIYDRSSTRWWSCRWQIWRNSHKKLQKKVFLLECHMLEGKKTPTKSTELEQERSKPPGESSVWLNNLWMHRIYSNFFFFVHQWSSNILEFSLKFSRTFFSDNVRGHDFMILSEPAWLNELKLLNVAW